MELTQEVSYFQDQKQKEQNRNLIIFYQYLKSNCHFKMILNLIRNQDTEGSILSVAKENMSQRTTSLSASLLRDGVYHTFLG